MKTASKAHFSVQHLHEGVSSPHSTMFILTRYIALTSSLYNFLVHSKLEISKYTENEDKTAMARCAEEQQKPADKSKVRKFMKIILYKFKNISAWSHLI